MKRIIMVLVIIVILFIGFTLTKKPVVHYFKVKQIEKDILNFFNKKSDKHISEEGKVRYNYLYVLGNDSYDISYLIEYYIKKINTILNSANSNYDIDFDSFINSKSDFYLTGLNYYTRLKDKDFDMVKQLINKEKSKEYSLDTFDEQLVKKLEKVLEHKSSNLFDNWYMDFTENKIVELPYNCYLEFFDGGIVDYDWIKKVYFNSEFIKCELNKTSCDYSFNNVGTYAKLTYKINNIESFIQLNVRFEDCGKYIMITPTPEIKFVKQEDSNEPYIELKSHYADIENDESERQRSETNDINRMASEGINEDVRQKVCEMYRTNFLSKKLNKTVALIEQDFFDNIERGLGKEESNQYLLDNWYYDDEKKVNIITEINDMRYKGGVDNIEILDRVRQHYDRDMNDSAIRTMIDNIVQSYIEYVKRGLSREEAYIKILNNWTFD